MARICSGTTKRGGWYGNTCGISLRQSYDILDQWPWILTILVALASLGTFIGVEVSLHCFSWLMSFFEHYC